MEFQSIVSNQTDNTKNDIHDAIEADNLPLLKQLFETHKIVPNEEISASGHAWTCLHYACHYGSCKTFEFLLKQSYNIYKQNFGQIINAKSSEGWNLLHLACIYGKETSLDLLLKCGGIMPYVKDNNGQTALDLAKIYGMDKVTKTLSEYIALLPAHANAELDKFATPVNTQFLKVLEEAKKASGNSENKNEQHEVSTRKNQVHQAIKTGDLPFLQKLTKLYKLVPNEVLSTSGHFWTSIHYACHLDSCIILDFLLKQAYSIYNDEYPHIINSHTSEGWTPLMIACIYGADSCLNLLLRYGGVKLYEKDNTGMRAIDLAKKYSRENAFKALTQQTTLYPPKVIVAPAEFTTPLNKDILGACTETEESATNKAKLTKVEDKDEYQHILRYGERLPCVICQGSKGWIKYLECCGNPVHPLCTKQTKICACCGAKPLCLTTDIKDPEKCFVIHPVSEMAQLAVK